nr:thiamine pyrophosphate-binding protein [Psychrobacter sp. JCM 18903]
MTQTLQTSSSAPATPSLTCGELLVQWLEYYGVETVFGIPGVHTVELYRGLPNTNIRHVTPRHEQGAGFMLMAIIALLPKLACVLSSQVPV